MQTAAVSLASAAAGGLTARAGNDPQRVKEEKQASGVLRLAIVGAGEIAPRFLEQAAQGSRARFVAICSRTKDAAKARAIEYGVGAWFDDYERMYDTVKPDAVIIATPHALHAKQSIAALNRGMHVLCEKPMATSLADCYAMVAAAEQSGAVLLCMPYDVSPAFMTALDYLNEATLGVFTGAEAYLMLPGPSRDQGDWSNDPKMAGGGAMLSTMVYPVSRLIGLLGPARRVTAFVNTLIPHRLVGDGKTIDAVPPPRNSTRRLNSSLDDNVSLLIEWASGQHAFVRSLWGTSILRLNDTVIYGRQGTMWIAGDDVVIHSIGRSIPGAEPTTWNGQADCYKISPKEIPKNEGLIDHFVDCIEGRVQPTCGAKQQLHVHEILFKGYESALTGRVQDLRTSFIPWHPTDSTLFDTRSRPV
jgi:predicted dehydrogenase